jgi:hypothetical protein
MVGEVTESWIHKPARIPGQPALFLRELIDDLPQGASVLNAGWADTEFVKNPAEAWL